MTGFTITTNPDGSAGVVIDGQDVSDRVRHVIVDMPAGQVPTVTMLAVAPQSITGDAIVTVIDPPTVQQVDEAALAALERINVQLLSDRCAEKVRAGRRDPYRVCLETIVEMCRA